MTKHSDGINMTKKVAMAPRPPIKKPKKSGGKGSKKQPKKTSTVTKVKRTC